MTQARPEGWPDRRLASAAARIRARRAPSQHSAPASARAHTTPVPRRPAVSTLIALALALTPLAAQAFTLPWAAEAPPPPAPPRPVVVEIASVSASPLRAVPGIVAAASQVVLAFQTAGRLTERPVDLGDSVARGAVLARLDPEDLQGDLRAAEAALEAATVQRDTARASAERTRALAGRDVASRAQLEQAEQRLASAEAAAEQAASRLVRARDAEGFATLTAPFDGVVSAVRQSPGAVVNAGDPVLTLSETTRLEAVIDLPEAALDGLAPGSAFTVTAASEGQAAIPATIARIEPLADAATRTRRVRLTLPPDVPLRLGALIRATPAIGAGALALTLPEAAILRLPDQPPAIWVVTRTDAGATVARRPVTTGPAFDGRVSISAGLAEGEEVVIRGVHALTEGQSVGKGIAP